MTWWLWVLGGFLLLAIEVATPGGFFAFFFGVSALLVGGLVALGIAGPVYLQWVLFTVVAVAALALLRGPLQARLNLSGQARPVDSLVGERAVVITEIPASGSGKVEMRGSSWSARSSSGQPLILGRRCVVDRVDGLTLWVREED